MRAVNRIAAALLGLVLLAVGLIATFELALGWAGRRTWPPWLDRWLGMWRTTTIGDRRVFWIAVAVGAVGLLILLFQLRRWRPDRLPTGDAQQGVWWVSRRGVERRARASTELLPGVHDAEARVRGGAGHWKVRVTAAGNPDQTESVERALRDELERLDLPEDVPVEVALHLPRRVV